MASARARTAATLGWLLCAIVLAGCGASSGPGSRANPAGTASPTSGAPTRSPTAAPQFRADLRAGQHAGNGVSLATTADGPTFVFPAAIPRRGIQVQWIPRGAPRAADMTVQAVERSYDLQSNLYGITCRASQRAFYFFAVARGGYGASVQWRIGKLSGGTASLLAHGIISSLGSQYTLRAQCAGSTLTLGIENVGDTAFTQLGTARDTIIAAGQAGVFMSVDPGYVEVPGTPNRPEFLLKSFTVTT